MKYKGKIEKIKHIVVSDPTYDKNVWCRYENNNIDNKDLVVIVYIDKVKNNIEDYEFETVDFAVLIKTNDDDCSVTKDGYLKHLKNIKITKYDIGVDTACVAIGVNEYAKNIVDSKDEWQPECAIRTGADGIFGTVIEGKNDDELCFIFIEGYFDSDFIDTNKLLDYLTEKLCIKELIVENETDKETKGMVV
ncbi:MAG: hypothetical protein KIC90_03405 [Firmicutes bacterium]|jgi:hypothetical protein|nr:hypothetical protein [Bacillota bacterium]